MTCLGCHKKPVAPGRYWYCSRRCQLNRANRRYRLRHGCGRGQTRAQKCRPRGRVCSSCEARDTEVPFTGHDRCDACGAAIRRYGICPKHKQPRGKHGCHACLWQDKRCPVTITDGQRSRVIYRHVHRGRVKVGDRYRLIHGWPVVILLTPIQYAQVRS